MAIPLTDRQISLIGMTMECPEANPFLLIVDNGQDFDDVVAAMTGAPSRCDDDAGGVARFGSTRWLVSDARELFEVFSLKAAASKLVTIEFDGGAYCAPELMELIQYLLAEEFELPRIVLIAEKLDVECEGSHLGELKHSLGWQDLVDDRSPTYYSEILRKLGVAEQLSGQLANFHGRLQGRDLPAGLTSLRRLETAAKLIQRLSITSVWRIVNDVYVRRCGSDRELVGKVMATFRESVEAL